MSMELKSQINKAEQEKDIKTLEEIKENAEVGFEGEIAGLAKAALDRLHGKVEDAEKTPDHVVEKLGEDKVEEVTAEVDKEIEELKEKTEGEIGEVVKQESSTAEERFLEEHSIEKPKSKNLEEIQHYIDQTALERKVTKDKFKEQVLAIFDSATEEDLIKLDRNFGFRNDVKMWEETPDAEKNKKRKEVFDMISDNPSDSFGDLNTLKLVSGYSQQQEALISELKLKHRELSRDIENYSNVYNLITSLDKESDQVKKTELINNFKKYQPPSAVLFESLAD